MTEWRMKCISHANRALDDMHAKIHANMRAHTRKHTIRRQTQRNTCPPSHGMIRFFSFKRAFTFHLQLRHGARACLCVRGWARTDTSEVSAAEAANRFDRKPGTQINVQHGPPPSLSPNSLGNILQKRCVFECHGAAPVWCSALLKPPDIIYRHYKCYPPAVII